MLILYLSTTCRHVVVPTRCHYTTRSTGLKDYLNPLIFGGSGIDLGSCLNLTLNLHLNPDPRLPAFFTWDVHTIAQTGPEEGPVAN